MGVIPLKFENPFDKMLHSVQGALNRG
jgi:hypothetical protein